jgi:tol-pal system protein YbgF
MAVIRGFLFVFCLSALCACANQDALLRKQAEQESRLETLAKGSSLTNQQVNGISNDLKDLQDQVRKNSAEIRELRESVMNLRAAADEQLLRKTAGRADKPTPKIEVINTTAQGAKKSRTDVRAEEYMKAFGLYSANKYEEAIESFTAFIKAYPDSEYSANAQYWIGECYYTRSNFPKALEAFKKVISTYPNGNKVPDAMLKAGYTLFALKQKDSATALLESLVKRFPDNPAAAKAREKLNQQ